MTNEEREIFERALDLYGVEHQKLKLIEEIGELQAELCRMQDGRSDLDRIAEEMADVLICLDQLRMGLQCGGAVQAWRLRKVERLRERLEAGE